MRTVPGFRNSRRITAPRPFSKDSDLIRQVIPGGVVRICAQLNRTADRPSIRFVAGHSTQRCDVIGVATPPGLRRRHWRRSRRARFPHNRGGVGAALSSGQTGGTQASDGDDAGPPIPETRQRLRPSPGQMLSRLSQQARSGSCFRWSSSSPLPAQGSRNPNLYRRLAAALTLRYTTSRDIARCDLT